MQRTLRLVLEYDGTDFCGWQVNPEVRTVQEVLRQALVTMTREPELKVYGASRTDAGVHALGQVASFTTETSIPAIGFHRGLNSLLPPDLAVISCADAEPGFQARHSARGKQYRYLILNQADRSPRLRRTSWSVRAPLDRLAMAEGAAYLIGTHDFSAFRAVGCTAATTVKQLHRVTVVERPGSPLVAIEVVGVSFLKYMVRNLVGTLVQVGLGRKEPAWVGAALASLDRGQAGPTAPAHGLTLVRVYYDEKEVEQA